MAQAALGNSGLLLASCGVKTNRLQSVPLRCIPFQHHRRSCTTYWSIMRQKSRYGEVAVRAQAASNNDSLQRSGEEKRVNGYVNGTTNGNGNGSGNGNGYSASVVTKDGGIALKKSQNGQILEPNNSSNDEPFNKDELKDKSEEIKQLENKSKQAWENIASRDVKVAEAPGGKWNKFKAYSTFQRTFDIWKFFFLFIFKRVLIGQKWAYSKKEGGMTEENMKKKRLTLARSAIENIRMRIRLNNRWLKEELLRLGPTFIKIGQQFSTRVDLLEKEFIDELSVLQDKVPPFPAETAKATVRRELGRPIEEVFSDFEDEPFAAASLGQVHLATLKSTGERVVVKVQRPGLKELFDIDLKNLRVIASQLNKFDPKIDGTARDWTAVYDECARVLYEEIDYRKEADNATAFADNFKKSGIDWVKAPIIYREATTSSILTMEYCPGVKVNNTSALESLGVDRQRIAKLSVEAYLQQILNHGLFHADPHPGNIAVDPKDGGKLIFYDYGMMGRIPTNIREGLVECFYGVYEKSPQRVVNSLVDMGVLVPGKDQVSVLKTARFFLNQFEERLKQQRSERKKDQRDYRERGYKDRPTKEEAKQKRSSRLAAIGEDLLSISADQPFRFPATFTFVVRAFSVLDGIGKNLDPRFDISEIARPYAQEILNLNPNTAVTEVLRKDVKKRWDRQAQAAVNLVKGPDRIEKMADIVDQIANGDLKIRVRNLEAEREFVRIKAVQSAMSKAVFASVLFNAAIFFSIQASKTLANVSFYGAIAMAVLAVAGYGKVSSIDKKNLVYKGTVV